MSQYAPIYQAVGLAPEARLISGDLQCEDMKIPGVLMAYCTRTEMQLLDVIARTHDNGIQLTISHGAGRPWHFPRLEAE